MNIKKLAEECIALDRRFAYDAWDRQEAEIRMAQHAPLLAQALILAMEALDDLVLNTSTSMPPAWNDELSWNHQQLLGLIGRAARWRTKIAKLGEENKTKANKA